MSARTISTIFTDILFKPQDYKSNDMIFWRLFNDLLTIMISQNEEIFSAIDERIEIES